MKFERIEEYYKNKRIPRHIWFRSVICSEE